MDREETNKTITDSFNNILNHKPTERELIRKKEIEEILRKEKEEYEKKRTKFYNNPLHWSNNKRRRYGLSVLRGEVNKHRSKRYPTFRPTPSVFFIIEDVIEETLTNKLNQDDFFNQFVDFKDMILGDANVFYISK